MKLKLSSSNMSSETLLILEENSFSKENVKSLWRSRVYLEGGVRQEPLLEFLITFKKKRT